MEQFRVAIVYGRSVKHQPQRVGLSHLLEDEDISKFATIMSRLSADDRISYHYQEVTGLQSDYDCMRKGALPDRSDRERLIQSTFS